MKQLIALTVFSFFTLARGEPPAQTRIIGSVPDGTPPPQRAAVPQQAFKVETARTIQLADRKLTIRRVAPPIPIPSATAKPEKNAVNTNPQAPELDTSTDTELLHISATVHQKRLAHVRGWTPGGQEFSA